jgi:hypothetical protein
MKKFIMSCFFLFLFSGVCLAARVENFISLDSTLWQFIGQPGYTIGFDQDKAWLCNPESCSSISVSGYGRATFSGRFSDGVDMYSFYGRTMPLMFLGVANICINNSCSRTLIYKIKNNWVGTIN